MNLKCRFGWHDWYICEEHVSDVYADNDSIRPYKERIYQIFKCKCCGTKKIKLVEPRMWF